MSRDRARDEVKHSHGVTTLSRGHSFSVVLHPEHKEAIRNLPDGGSHSFRDETKKRWVATRDGDQVHFHNPDQGYRHSASMSHLRENVEPSHMIRETALEILREARDEPAGDKAASKKRNRLAGPGGLYKNLVKSAGDSSATKPKPKRNRLAGPGGLYKNLIK